MSLETRITPDSGLEVREIDGQGPRLVGYAAVYNRLSETLGAPPYEFREQIMPGAFGEIGDVKALVGHDRTKVLGRNTAGTLFLRSDDRGLAVEIDPPDTGYARDLLVSVARGDVSGMSFGFKRNPGGDTWVKDSTGMMIRTLVGVTLFEVTITAFGAYADTSIAVRSLEDWQEANKRQGQKPGALGVFKRRLQLLTR
jgi:hypothetical protein